MRLREQAPTFDLQSHSVYSDGALPAAEVVRSAAQAGVELLALSDHDTIEGLQEAQAAAAETGVRLVPAVEISAVYRSDGDLHILGYLIDPADPVLGERLVSYRADRVRRSEAMADALRELGFQLDEEALAKRARAGKPIGRPHLAQAVVGHPANAERLKDEGRLDLSVFLQAYLIEGRPAFRLREHPTVADAIEVIHDAGGLAVWAHPFWDVSDPPGVLERIDTFRAAGLDGVECFYPTHDREQTQLLTDRCRELELLSTGSSDFHGPAHRLFSSFRAFSTYDCEPVLGAIAE